MQSVGRRATTSRRQPANLRTWISLYFPSTLEAPAKSNSSTKTAGDLASAFAKARRKSARNANMDLAGTPPPCSDEELSKQSCRQRPACAAECSQKIGRSIRCQSLQAFQQRPAGHESSPDHKRAGPSKAEHRRDREIAEEVLDLPTEPRAGLPFGGGPGR